MTRDELLALVDGRAKEIRTFIDWAERQKSDGSSMYLANRPDIRNAEEAAAMYAPWQWWGVVVFTCFGSLNSARALRHVIAEPMNAEGVKAILASFPFTRPTVGHHRTRPGLLGAKKALVAACLHSDVLRAVLHGPGSFHHRYRSLRTAHLDSWGRTTCFDLLVRAGALAIGGKSYEPKMAYLAESTGPKGGFRAVWGRDVTGTTARCCERVLQAWYRHWREVADRVGARWRGRPYAPGDLENALCIYESAGRHPPCG